MWPYPARITLDGAPLYHFTSFRPERFAQIVTENRIYFSRPADFNDPFECSPIVDLESSIVDAVARRRLIDDYQATLRAAGLTARLEQERDLIRRAYDDPETRAEDVFQCARFDDSISSFELSSLLPLHESRCREYVVVLRR